MSQIKEISVGFTYTKNLGNYESLKVDAGVVVSIGAEDDHRIAYDAAWETVKKQIKCGLETAKGGF